MRTKTFIISLAITAHAFCQTNEKILLEWKLQKNDTLRYKTAMNITQEDKEVEGNMDTTSIISREEIKELQKSVLELNSDIKYQINLYENNRNNKWVDIEMVMLNKDKVNSNDFLKEMMSLQKDKSSKKDKKKDKKKNNEVKPDSLNFKKLFSSISGLNGNVVLRGRISKTGEIVSTYYKNSQRNLISILFELPNKNIGIGEKWKLNVNLIEMDQNFVCDSLNKENYAYIEKVIEKDGDKIAIIKYNLLEYVKGDFNNPINPMFGMESNKKMYMKATHNATGYFSILKGKWINYEGTLIIESNFSIINGKTKTEYKLEE